MTSEEAIKRLSKRFCLDFYRCEICNVSRVDACEIAMAKEALEKQIQKAPEKRIDYSTNTEFSKNETPVTEYYCSKCNKRIYVSENFCTQCGQKIDWSSEDE